MKLIFTLFFLVAVMSVNAQTCNVTITGPNRVCPGVPITYTGTATVTQANQAFDFNNNAMPPGWSSTGTASFGSLCGNSPDNSPYFWASTSTGTPQIVTDNFDVCTGGTINFEMRYAVQGGSVPCEGPDEQDEGVSLQYSTNNGATWVDIIYYSPWGFTLPSNPGGNTSINGATAYTTWNNFSVPIPAAAITANTKFRWVQINSSGGCCDNWGLDNVFINAGACLPANIGWDVAGGGGASGNSVTIPIYSDTTIIAGVYDDNGVLVCQSAPFQVQVFNPFVEAGANQTICAGQSVTLSGSSGTNFTWNNGVSNGVSFIPTATTTYTVTGTDVNGCIATDNVTITVNPLINNNLSYPNSAYCKDATDPTPTLSTVVAGTYSVLPNTVTINATTGVLDLSTSTTTTTQDYVVSFTPTNPCYSVVTTTVTIHNNPIVNAGTDVAICIGSSTTLTASGATSYVWNNGAGSSASVTVSPTTTTTYTVTGTNSFGCTNTDDVVVQVNALPSVNAGTDVAICIGSSTTLTASGATNYVWNNGAGSMASVSVSPTATTTYTVTGTDNNGCVNTDDVVVTVNPLPIVNAGSGVAICIGASTTLTASGATNYVWNNGAGSTASVTVSPTATTTYTVTGTDNNGCVNTDQVIVTVNSLPPVNAGTDVAICIGASTTLTASGATNYVWNNGAGSTAVVTVSPTATTTYTVTGTDNNGCVNTDDVVVTVNPLPIVNAGTDVAICIGSSTTLTASGATNYVWNNGAGSTASVSVSPTATTTYTVTGTDNNGCVNTDDVVVTVNPLPIVNAGSDVAICTGFSTTLTASGATNYVWNNGAGSTAVVTVSPTATTTYTVTGTDNNGCVNTDQVIVTVNSLPPVNAGTDVAICIGASTTLTASGATNYVWNNGAGSTASVTVSPTATTTYMVTGTDNNGCVNTDEVVVTVNPLPNVNAGADAVICYGLSTTLTASGATNYVWNNGAGSTASVTVSPTATTTYTVTGTDNNGCVNTDEVVVTVNPLPNVNAGTDVAICIGSSTTLTASGATNYVWNNGAGSTAVVTVSPTATTTYTVTGTDNNGCVNTDQVVVTVNPLPIVNAGNDTTICSENYVIMLATGNAASYVWDNNIASNGASVRPIIGSTTYTVTATSSYGCVNTDQRIINVNPLPTATISGNISVCKNDAQPVVTFTASNGTGPYVFRYTYNGGATQVLTSDANGIGLVNVPTTIAGNHIFNLISVQDASSTACLNSQTGTVTVVVNDLPTAGIGGTTVVCQNSTSPYVVFAGGNTVAPYTFTYLLNGVQNTVTSVGNNAIIEAPTGVVGTYEYQLVSVQDASSTRCSVSQTGSATVTINPLPIGTMSPDMSVCRYGNEPTITFSAANGSAPYTFTFTINGSNQQTVIANSNSISLSIPTANAGTFQYELVSVKESSVTACFNYSSDTTLIRIWELPIVSAGIDRTVCEGQPIVLSGQGAATYTWSPNIYNGIPFTPQDTTTYSVIGTDVNGCVNYDTVTIRVVPTPTVDFITRNGSSCAPLVTSLMNTSTGNLANCEWVLSDGTILSGCGQQDLVLENPGCYDVTLNVTTVEGCSQSKTIPMMLCVLQNPIASFTVNPDEVKSSNTMVHFFNQSEHNHRNYWVFQDGTTSTQEEPIHYFPDTHPNNYSVMLVVASADGCLDTTYRTVRVLEDLIYYVPNAFTPDGDEYNNVFKPVLTAGFDVNDYRLAIYNRWGELIFESLDHDYGWDGAYKGKIQMDGTYVWKIYVKKLNTDERVELVGHVTIVK